MGDGDPENDRLPYVWLPNNARPAWWQRAAAAMPFLYGSAGGRRQDGLTPQPLIDLSAKHPKVWNDLGQAALQVWTFDPAGLAAPYPDQRDPWRDSRPDNWNGYAGELESGEKMIPLALYDLEHPRAPLLLVDFRDNLKPKRREIFQRSVTDLMKSVLGLSYLRDWYYFVPGRARDFVAWRRGAALDPLARLRAYAILWRMILNGRRRWRPRGMRCW